VPDAQSWAISSPISGTVVSVRSAAVDVRFDSAKLPEINTALDVKWDREESLALEVHRHVDPATVRGIALQATAGLAHRPQTGCRSHDAHALRHPDREGSPVAHDGTRRSPSQYDLRRLRIDHQILQRERDLFLVSPRRSRLQYRPDGAPQKGLTGSTDRGRSPVFRLLSRAQIDSLPRRLVEPFANNEQIVGIA
jgi:hypothetical protein